MKKIIALLLLVLISGCVKVGEFSPESHALYEKGNPDCEKTPERCIDGVPW